MTIGIVLVAVTAFIYWNGLFSQNTREALISVRDDSSIEAVLISVDSSGGSAVAGQEVAAAIKEVGKPVAVIVGDSALSAAYLAISTADVIFAYEQSEVGSMGITMSYLENVEKNKKDGLSFVEITSGKFKELASQDKPLSWEERQLLQKQVDEYHDLMVKEIAENRDVPLERIQSLADGRFFSGVKAKELGLIDEVGTYFDTLHWIENKIGKKAEICEQ